MEISRRNLMISGAAAGLASVVPLRVTSMEIGGLKIDSVSDGLMDLPAANFYSNLPEGGAEILQRYGQTSDRSVRPCNVTLLRDGERTVLFDVGGGPDFVPGLGQLPDTLDALGVAPEDVTDVVFTHAHPDHINGLLDDFEDPLFYDANHHIGQIEWDFWTDPDTVNVVRADRQGFAVGAARRLEAVEGQINIFGDGDEVLPGVVSVATYGHTPGHMSFVLGGKMILLGDAVTDHHLSFEMPDWPAAMDENGEDAVASRIRILDMAATDGLQVLGFHLPNDGIGNVETSGTGFKFIQES